MKADDLFGVTQYRAGEFTYRGRLADVESIRRFVEAGKATITIVSTRSGTRYTLRFSRPSESDAQLHNQPFATRPIWISLLTGTDNVNNYSFMGTIFPGRCLWQVNRSAKSKVSEDAPSWTAMLFFVESLYLHPDRLPLLEVWHEGSCGRCGRKLTVPESIQTGFGPECAGRMRL